MNLRTTLATLIGALALMLAPTAALAVGPEYEVDPPQHHPTHPAHPTPGPKAPMPQKAKAYGVYCRGFSKQHVAGEKGTPFSRCVTAMAHAATSKKTARQACAGFSKKHLAGQKGTEFTRCVVAAAKVKKQAR